MVPERNVLLPDEPRSDAQSRPSSASSSTPSRPLRDLTRLRRAPSPVGLAVAAAVTLSVWYLMMPPMGTDLSAQVARADFVRAFGAHPIDLSWYGGVNQFAYSLTTPALMALVGARWLGVASAVVMTAAITRVMVRTGATRPRLGGVLIAAIAIDNVVSGRITFAAGLAVGACALELATRSPNGRPKLRLVAMGLLGALASVTSPVSGVFLGVMALAWCLAEVSRDRARGWVARVGRGGIDAAALGAGTLLGLIPMALFSDGGRQPYSVSAMRDFIALSVVVALIVPATNRALRLGALLTAVLLAVTYYVPGPLGANVVRLPLLFAIPVTAAYVPWRTWALVTALAGMFWWRPPVVLGDVRTAGTAQAQAGFYQPLRDELRKLGPVGRIEVVPLRDHWESVYLSDTVPIARGWLRQVDISRNPLFYRAAPLTPAAYGSWLRANAASYVAAATGQTLDTAGSAEAAVLAGGPRYLREVWHGGAWTLYRVVDSPLLVQGANLASANAGSVVFDAPAPGTVLVHVRWSRWLTVSRGACATASADGWTEIAVRAAGRYTLSSSLFPGC